MHRCTTTRIDGIGGITLRNVSTSSPVFTCQRHRVLPITEDLQQVISICHVQHILSTQAIDAVGSLNTQVDDLDITEVGCQLLTRNVFLETQLNGVIAGTAVDALTSPNQGVITGSRYLAGDIQGKSICYMGTFSAVSAFHRPGFHPDLNTCHIIILINQRCPGLLEAQLVQIFLTQTSDDVSTVILCTVCHRPAINTVSQMYAIDKELGVLA